MPAVLRAGCLASAFALSAGGAAAQDDGLLSSLLRDHCLPWVTEGIAPVGTATVEIIAPETLVLFSGREQDATLFAARIDGGRFEAIWGRTADAATPATRLCSINAAPGDAFAIPGDLLVSQVTAALEGTGLVADKAAPDPLPGTLGWSRPGDAPQSGLRLVLVAWDGFVTAAIMADDRP